MSTHIITLKMTHHLGIMRTEKNGFFRVFKTGNPHYYLLRSIGPTGIEGEIQFALDKRTLSGEMRKIIAYGYGNSN